MQLSLVLLKIEPISPSTPKELLFLSKIPLYKKLFLNLNDRSSRAQNIKTFWLNHNLEASSPGNKEDLTKFPPKEFIMLQGTTIYKNRGGNQDFKNFPK